MITLTTHPSYSTILIGLDFFHQKCCTIFHQQRFMWLQQHSTLPTSFVLGHLVNQVAKKKRRNHDCCMSLIDPHKDTAANTQPARLSIRLHYTVKPNILTCPLTRSETKKPVVLAGRQTGGVLIMLSHQSSALNHSELSRKSTQLRCEQDCGEDLTEWELGKSSGLGLRGRL